MAAFIDELKYCLENRIPVFVDIKEVEELELNAITVLLAVMVQFNREASSSTETCQPGHRLANCFVNRNS